MRRACTGAGLSQGLHDQRIKPRWQARGGSLTAVLLLAAAAAAASPTTGGQILSPSAGAVLHAGELVEIRWSPLAGEVDELELLLSPDGSWRSPLRLTQQLDPASGRFTWRVPNLPATAAQLRIRFGGPEGEELATPGAPFSIVVTRDAPLAGLRLVCSELWVSGVHNLATALIDRPEQRLGAEGEETQPIPLGLPSHPGGPDVAPGPATVIGTAPRTVVGTLLRMSLLRRPTTIPLRQ